MADHVPHARSRNARIWTVIALLGLLYLLGRTSGISDWLEPEQLRTRVQAAGPWGPVAFMALFVGAVIFQIPAIPFVLAAPALFP